MQNKNRVRVIIILFFVVLGCLDGFSQGSFKPQFKASVSALAMYEVKNLLGENDINSGRIGISGRYETDRVNIQSNITADEDALYLTVKTGINVLPADCPFKLNVYPFYFDGKRKIGHRTPFEVEVQTRLNNWILTAHSSWTAYNGVYFGGKTYYTFAGYKGKSNLFDNKFIIGNALCFLGGFIHGVGEQYQRDRTLFERYFDANPKGFWGSQSWLRKYQVINGEPQLSREVLWYTPFSDFHHVANWSSKGLYMAGTTVLVVGEKYKWYEIIGRVGAGFFSASLGSYLGFTTFNNKG